MKRTPLKRKTRLTAKSGFKQAKKGHFGASRAIKKPKKNPVKALKVKLWELCKQITRLKYGNVCYTCGATGLEGSNWHTAHFIASSVCGAYLRYDLRNLRPGCYRCNISLAGNGAHFYKNLVEREGQQYVDQIFQDKQKTIKADIIFFQDKIKEYEDLLRVLQTNQ